ncbi:hypothetical protein V6N12_068817 [Hibiscus sabdariffa]|uniref:FAD-binding PCMH-type domain-containing protein n=1 Tax=Hibiscus sabdariffa TaxID=183260 RepID=A0ABR2B0W7_9ROSI
MTWRELEFIHIRIQPAAVPTPHAKYNTALSSTLSIFWIFVLLSISLVTSNDSVDFDSFLRCLPTRSNSSILIPDAILTPNNSSFESIYQLRTNNLGIFFSTSSRPAAIITALHPSHAQATVICAKRHGFHVRIRSGGHDFEGLSYTSDVPFVILDMFNLRSIDVDVANETVWVQAGATTGELYYRIAEKSNVHGFPSGYCTTLGIGGHFSGVGYGFLMRKYGLSIDNVIDAQLIDVDGRILNRELMGEDVFWAIREGGTTSFGIILSWRVRLVLVPPRVTIFTVQRTLEQSATELAYRWEQVAPKLPTDLYIRLQAQPINNKTSRLCIGVVYLMEPPLMCCSIELFHKSKSDYYKTVIPKQGSETLWEGLMDIEHIIIQQNPYGGRMEEISEPETAFAHRQGNLFMMLYAVQWTESDRGIDASGRYVEQLRKLYSAMAPYASSNPREAFVNYRDLDIDSNESGETKEYGAKYFRNNFKRLAGAKARVDLDNFFKNDQSIPSFVY